MLGWMISVYRQRRDGTRPATFASAEGERIAVWQGGLSATDWLDDLVSTGRAIDLGGDGYPRRLTARAGALLPVVLSGPPEARDVWAAGPEDILGPGWIGKTFVDASLAERCDDDEWLLVEIWDES